MKKIAALLLFAFALIQAGPVISTIFSDAGYVLIVDKENGEDKSETQKKQLKDFITCIYICSEFTHSTNTAFHFAEEIQLPPSLDNLTPPPNFN